MSVLGNSLPQSIKIASADQSSLGSVAQAAVFRASAGVAAQRLMAQMSRVRFRFRVGRVTVVDPVVGVLGRVSRLGERQRYAER